MTRRVVSRAFANIAIIKYWGKLVPELNVPATPSISLALDQLSTQTEVGRSEGNRDTIVLNDAAADKETTQRLVGYLDLWRERDLIEGHFAIKSTNNFPTKSGLASSASGFAALAKALSGFCKTNLSDQELSQLARRGSGSAARSIPGGLAVFPLGDDPAAKLLKRPDEVSWGMVIAIVDDGSKAIGSTEAMQRCRQSSPYYPAWLEIACRDYDLMVRAVANNDFTALGRIAETNALAMHACIMTADPPLMYWNQTTLALLKLVARWRDDALPVYATIDAGANVALIGNLDDLPAIAQRAIAVQGVVRVLICRPAGAAEIVSVQ
ncbi:MAG: diphosphomevalonate decarboxylase [bacterium]